MDGLQWKTLSKWMICGLPLFSETPICSSICSIFSRVFFFDGEHEKSCKMFFNRRAREWLGAFLNGFL